MTTTDTAAVQSLTAEVYVLYIGDRQITQSVAKQLDEADPGDLEPFGRVRLTGKGFDEGEWIIGRDDHGNLRIADYGQLGRCHVSNIPLHVWLREGYRETPQLLTDAWRHWTLTSPRSEEDILILTSPDLCRIKAARSAVTVHRPISIFEIQDDIDSGVINEGSGTSTGNGWIANDTTGSSDRSISDPTGSPRLSSTAA